MPDATLANTLVKGEAIVRAVREAAFRDGKMELPRVTISIGVSAFPEHGETLASLLSVADRALYRAKQAGRDRVVSADGVFRPPAIAEAS